MPSFSELIPGYHEHEYYACCPECIKRVGVVDTLFKLGINVKSGVFHCYRCGFKGRVKDLADFAFYVADERWETVRQRLEKLDAPIVIQKFSVNIDDISFPISAREAPNASKYLESRGIGEDIIEKFNLRAGKGEWKNRIILPYFEEERCSYVIGRSYTGSTIRYKNTSVSKYNVLYGVDLVTEGKAIICEGVFSAIAAYQATGIPAVALLGKNFSDGQLDKLRAVASSVFVSFDGTIDVTEKIKIQTALILRNRGFKVRIVDLPFGKDPDDLRGEYREYLMKSRKF